MCMSGCVTIYYYITNVEPHCARKNAPIWFKTVYYKKKIAISTREYAAIPTMFVFLELNFERKVIRV